MRRHRRLDLFENGTLVADVLFRDSYVDAEGRETIVHEYTLRAAIDPVTLRVQDVDAAAHVLPWVECEPAVASATARGRPLRLRPASARARRLHRHPTCTHLNDTLRSLEDVGAPRGCRRSRVAERLVAAGVMGR